MDSGRGALGSIYSRIIIIQIHGEEREEEGIARSQEVRMATTEATEARA